MCHWANRGPISNTCPFVWRSLHGAGGGQAQAEYEKNRFGSSFVLRQRQNFFFAVKASAHFFQCLPIQRFFVIACSRFRIYALTSTAKNNCTSDTAQGCAVEPKPRATHMCIPPLLGSAQQTTPPFSRRKQMGMRMYPTGLIPRLLSNPFPPNGKPSQGHARAASLAPTRQ